MRKLIFALLPIILLNCSESKSPYFLQDDSVWIFSSENISEPGKFKNMKLRFRKNGYAYEENTILTYPYSYNRFTKTFEINNQLYKVLQTSENKLVLENKKTGIKVLLYKN